MFSGVKFMSAAPSVLTPAERKVVDGAVRLVADCVPGFDDALVDALRDLLAEVVELDAIAIMVEDEENGIYRLQGISALGGSARSPIAVGEWSEEATAYLRFESPPSATRVRVVEDARQRENEVARAAAKMGTLSYVMVPIHRMEAALGWLTVTHRVPGAPSQRACGLLVEIARVLAPAVARARTFERQPILAALVEQSPDGIIALAPGGAVLEANAQAVELLARPRKELVGKNLSSVVADAAFAKLLTVLLRESTPREHVEVMLQGGPVDASVAPLPGLGAGSLLLCLRDARPRKAAEEAAAGRVEQAAFLRALGEAMAGASRADAALERAVDICFVRYELEMLCGFRCDAEGALRLVAAHGTKADLTPRLLAQADEEVKALFGLRAPLAAHRAAVLVSGAKLPGDEPEDGPRWMMLLPLFHARKRLGALLIVGQAGEEAAANLRDSWEPIGNTIAVALRAAAEFERVVSLEAEKRQLVDNLPVIVQRLDPVTGKTLFVNAALARVLGVELSALGPEGMQSFLADSLEVKAFDLARERAAAGIGSGWEDRRYRHADGRVLTLRESVYPVFDAAQAVHAIEVLAYDITTEIDARKQLMQSDRLASLGALAAGVAHEINNPIAFISLATGQMNRLIDQARRREPGAHERLREVAKEVTDAAGQIAEIVGELKLFTRIPEGAAACPVDINRMLQTALTLTAPEVRRHALLEVDLGPLPLGPGAFAGLGHVFSNMLINAGQAVESKRRRDEGGGGSRCGAALADQDVVRVTSRLEDGAIVVRISDTGVGIDEKVIGRIFDPFFKAGGHGTGLGLAIAYDLVRKVGGDIRVTSSPGAGSQFDIILPLEPALLAGDTPATGMRARPAELSAGVDLPLRSLSRLRRVLIIDDEHALVKALARQLAERYEVDTAVTATDALAKLGKASYDAVVCDLRLPEQSGHSIYDVVAARSPEQASRFIFTTGGSYGAHEDEPHTRAEATGLPVLEKPFDGASFEAAVERVASREA